MLFSTRSMVSRAIRSTWDTDPPASDPYEIRRSFLQLNPTTRTPVRPREDERFRATSSASLAKAAAFLPGEYAALRNIMVELRSRLGSDWLPDGSVVEVSSTVGAGLWALADAEGLLEPVTMGDGRLKPRDYQFCHAGRSGLELAERLGQSEWAGMMLSIF